MKHRVKGRDIERHNNAPVTQQPSRIAFLKHPYHLQTQTRWEGSIHLNFGVMSSVPAELLAVNQTTATVADAAYWEKLCPQLTACRSGSRGSDTAATATSSATAEEKGRGRGKKD